MMYSYEACHTAAEFVQRRRVCKAILLLKFGAGGLAHQCQRQDQVCMTAAKARKGLLKVGPTVLCGVPASIEGTWRQGRLPVLALLNIL